METETITVGVLDTEAPYRAGIRSALLHPRFRVEEAGTLTDLARRRGEAKLDVLLVDERLFPVGGIADERVALIAQTPTIAGMVDAFQRGAVGYIERNVDAERLRVAVADIAEGIEVAPRALVALLVATRFPLRGVTDTTRRQSQVSVLAREGLSTREIAMLLNISPVTVRRHRAELEARQRRSAA